MAAMMWCGRVVELTADWLDALLEAADVVLLSGGGSWCWFGAAAWWWKLEAGFGAAAWW